MSDRRKAKHLDVMIRRLERLDRAGNLTGDGFLWLQNLKRERDSLRLDNRGKQVKRDR